MTAARTVGRMTLKAEWESYLRRVFDQPPSLVQTETQRAFYAGAAAMFSLFLATTEVTEDEGEAALDALQAELTAYAARIGRSDELSPLPPEIEAQYEVKDADAQARLRTLGEHDSQGAAARVGVHVVPVHARRGRLDVLSVER